MRNVVSVDELRDLMRGPEGRSSKNSRLDDALRNRLGHNNNAFAAMMGEAAKILEELSSRLKMETTDPSIVGMLAVFQESRN